MRTPRNERNAGPELPPHAVLVPLRGRMLELMLLRGPFSRALKRQVMLRHLMHPQESFTDAHG